MTTTASLALAEGRRDTALERLRDAASAWAGTDLGLATGVRYAIATLEAGDEGRRVCEEIMADVRAEGWRDERLGLTLRLPLWLGLLA